jgi:hypothetical protein
MMEALDSSETSVFTRAMPHIIPNDGILLEAEKSELDAKGKQLPDKLRGLQQPITEDDELSRAPCVKHCTILSSFFSSFQAFLFLPLLRFTEPFCIFTSGEFDHAQLHQRF